MKLYEVFQDSVNLAHLEDVLNNCVDKDQMYDIMRDIFDIIDFRGLSYKDKLLMEDMFIKGYISAHIKKTTE